MNNLYRVLLFVVISLPVAVTFVLYPQIDLLTSALFYRPVSKFYLNENTILMLLHNSVTYITIAIGILLISLIIKISITRKPAYGLTRLRVIYLLLSLIIAPGIIVNTVFKDHWGRARPYQIEEFGGKAKFTPAFIISNQCDVNCSFVSGDPSVGFYFLALAFAIPKRRKFFTSFGISFGVVLGATRIIQGAHFLSDVIFSGVFTFITVYLLYLLLLKLETRKQSFLQ